jgi:dihydroorotase (homodimeric type)
VYAAKLYPAGATTNSDSGVTSIDNIFPAIEAMAEVGMPLLVHGEVTRGEIDVFDREKRFIDEHMRRVVERFPTLKVVFEHITTSDAAQFVTEAPANVGATITAHHLLYNRNHMLVGGIRPHFYCLPILKRNTHQVALLDAATSGNPKFFLGTDSAPTPSTPRKPPAAAPAATPPTPPSSCMPKRSNSVTRWTSSKASPACTARTSTACRATPTPSPWSAKNGPPRQPAVRRANRYPAARR